MSNYYCQSIQILLSYERVNLCRSFFIFLKITDSMADFIVEDSDEEGGPNDKSIGLNFNTHCYHPLVKSN